MSGVQIKRNIFIEAKPSTIFSYFTDAGKLRLWLGQQVKLEPTERGRIEIDMNGHDVVLGAFKTIEPYERIVFTWGWKGSDVHPPESSIVEIALKPDANGTWLHLQHSSVPESERECHEDGWNRNLPRLRDVLTNNGTIGQGA